MVITATVIPIGLSLKNPKSLMMINRINQIKTIPAIITKMKIIMKTPQKAALPQKSFVL